MENTSKDAASRKGVLLLGRKTKFKLYTPFPKTAILGLVWRDKKLAR